ncbi:MAG: UTP--glucose-1-phosphate uridylyltransferase GalU [Succinivibrionaceae bacterium]
MKIKKAIIPVAGLGTRMLPATKAIPKEMLPIVDKPLIQYVVNEAVQAGIRDIIFVTHSSKNAIENHFDKSFELEATLEKRVKRQLLSEIKNILPHDVTIMHVRQGEAKGLAHAILCARSLVDDSDFAVLLPDVLIDQYKSDLKTENLAEMIQLFNKTGISQVMVEKVPKETVSNYGIVGLANSSSNTEITSLVEKPSIDEAPSDLAIVGRYVFSKEIWKYFLDTPLGAGGELQLTDTIKLLLKHQQVNAYKIKGRSLDCGSKLGYLKAIVEYGIHHEKYGDEFKEFLKGFCLNL